MELSDTDIELIDAAKQLVGERKVTGGAVKEVGAVLVTEKGRTFKGVSMDLSCGIGFCAEHSAISAMVTSSDETRVRTIVAYGKDGVMYPCGRCRELLQLINAWNRDNTEVIISEKEKVLLKDLLPGRWF